MKYLVEYSDEVTDYTALLSPQPLIQDRTSVDGASVLSILNPQQVATAALKNEANAGISNCSSWNAQTTKASEVKSKVSIFTAEIHI